MFSFVPSAPAELTAHATWNKKALQSFGRGKPLFIHNTEIKLWEALIDIAKGRELTYPRMQCALTGIQSILYAPDACPFPAWFSGKSFCWFASFFTNFCRYQRS